MKMRSFKKVLAAVLTTTLIMASTLMASASAGSTGSTGSTGSGATLSTGSGELPAKYLETIKLVDAGAKQEVAGEEVVSTVAGIYQTEVLQGEAVTTPTADLKKALGLSEAQTPFLVLFDTDKKKSNLAMACVDSAAKALGGECVSTINADLGCKENGVLKSLKDGEGKATMVVGLPKNADTTKTYFVVCVQRGGIITILPDLDKEPTTVTFELQAGLATYAFIAK